MLMLNFVCVAGSGSGDSYDTSDPRQHTAWVHHAYRAPQPVCPTSLASIIIILNLIDRDNLPISGVIRLVVVKSAMVEWGGGSVAYSDIRM